MIKELVQESWAWSPSSGVTRQPISRLVSYVLSTGLPLRSNSKRMAFMDCKEAQNGSRAACSPEPLDTAAYDCSGNPIQHQDQPSASQAHAKAATSGQICGSLCTLPLEGSQSRSLGAHHIAGKTEQDFSWIQGDEEDSIGSVQPSCMLIVPIIDLHDQKAGENRLRSSVIAVLKLVNKCRSPEGGFSFVDEVMVQTMASNASAALKMAEYVHLAPFQHMARF